MNRFRQWEFGQVAAVQSDTWKFIIYEEFFFLLKNKVNFVNQHRFIYWNCNEENTFFYIARWKLVKLEIARQYLLKRRHRKAIQGYS